MQRVLKGIAIGLVASMVATIGLTTPAVAADSTVVVTGDTAIGENQPGWMFGRDPSNATPYEFNSDEASTGKGSLYVEPISSITGAKKMIAEHFLQQAVVDLESISYDFMIAGAGVEADAKHFYLNVYANIDNSTNFYDCRFDYIPTSGSLTDFTKASFSTTSIPTTVTKRGSRITNCPTTLAGMPAGSYVRAFNLNVGDTSLSDTGLAGYLDSVAVDAVDGTTTYDFEPALAPATKDDCKDGKWASFNTPQIFKNQGECVSFMARTKTASLELNSNDMDGIDFETKNGNWYKVTVSGTWNNRTGESVDAECTKMGASSWANFVYPPGTYSPDLLDVQVNESFVSWGQCNTTNHIYSKWVMGDGTPMNLRVFDGDTTTNTQIPGWFGDNVGVLDITIESH